MPFGPSNEAERADGRLSLLYWILMGPQGINRDVYKMEFTDCKKGLGVKVIGGYREFTGEEFGIYIKRVLPGGLAAEDGQLKPGDLILEVNSIRLEGVSYDRAVEILRSAAFSNHMSLLVVRDEESRREFQELMLRYGSSSTSSSGRSSPTQSLSTLSSTTLSSTGRTDNSTSTSACSSRSSSPPHLSTSRETPPYTCTPNTTPPYNTPNTPSKAHSYSDSAIQLICVSKGTGLGLVIKGGTNHVRGPMVFVHEVVAGGDCHRDGRLAVGDQLVSINKESLIGVTYEQARSIITRTKLRPEPTVEIAFSRRRSSFSGLHSPSTTPDLRRCSLQPSRLSHSLGTLGTLPSPASLLPRRLSKQHHSSQTLPSLNLSRVPEVPVATETTCDHSSSDESSPSKSASITEAEPETPSACQPISSQELPKTECSLSSCSGLTMERLEQALHLFGLKLTEAQRETLRTRLQTDPAGLDFKSLTKELFQPVGEESAAAKGEASHDRDSTPHHFSSRFESPSNLKSQSDSDDPDEMEKLRKEHIEALREIKRLQEQLVQCQKLQQQMQVELQKVKQEVKAGEQRGHALQCRAQLAEVAQHQAREMEMDYEEVVKLLEAEIAEMKAQPASLQRRIAQPAQAREETEVLKRRVALLEAQHEETRELRRIVALLECQLRKSEGSRKAFEVSTNKLLKFVEITQDFLLESQGESSGQDMKDGRSQVAVLGKNSPRTAAVLAVEAKELTRTVRTILELDCLPYGWEEAYTTDGVKYFINHVTQTTSWTPPVTSTAAKVDQEGEGPAEDPLIEADL